MKGVGRAPCLATRTFTRAMIPAFPFRARAGPLSVAGASGARAGSGLWGGIPPPAAFFSFAASVWSS